MKFKIKEMYKAVKIIVIVMCLLFGVKFTFAQQQGVLTGKIIDKKTGEDLIGATVSIEGTTIGAIADLNGTFNLKAAPGTYNILCSFISYYTITIKGVKIEAGQINHLDFTMEEAGVAIQEVVIVAEAVKNTDASLVAMQKRSINVQDGVSAQQIAKSGSSNAAESMKQITGANTDDGKYMVMRGLGDRYSIAQLNGLQMASTDPYRNASSLDLIPSNFVDNIVTLKTFSPDQPGNFAGGNVNITTKALPEKFNVSFSVNPSYNSQSSLNDKFLTYQGGKNDKWGFDGGYRNMPEAVLDPAVRDQLNQSIYLSGSVLAQTSSYYNNPARKNLVDSTNNARAEMRDILHSTARSFNNQFIPTTTTAPLNSSYNFSIGNRFKVYKEQELGISGGANFSRTFTHYDNGRVATLININADSLFKYQDLKETKSVDNPQLGAFANLAYKFNRNHTVNVIGIYSNDAEKTARMQHGSFLGQVSDSKAIFNTNVLEFTQRQMKTIQANGNHVLANFFNVEIDWAGSATNSMQNEPDLRYLAYTSIADSVDLVDSLGNLTGRAFDTTYYMNNAEYSNPFHFFRNLNDKIVQGKLDITIPLNVEKTNRIKFGGYYSHLSRSFEEYRYQMITETSLNITHFEGNFDEFLSYDNFGITDTTYDYGVISNDPNKPRYNNGIKKYGTGHFYINQVNNKNFYTGTQTIAAGYAMGIFEITKKLKTVGGARLESTNMEVISKDVDSVIVKETNPSTGEILVADTLFTQSKINLLDVLPSLSLIYDLTDDIKIRAGFSKTIARPNLRELAPFEQFDTKNGFYLVGNPNLKRTVIQNYDLRLEWYPGVGDLVAVSGYYKNFTDPIIRAFNPSATIPELKFENVDKASVIGFEAEARKKLDFISSFTKDFTFATNFTFIKSRTDIRPTEVENSKAIDSTYNLTTRPFVGQSPYIVNAMLMYQNAKIGHESTLSFNVSGAKLYNVALFATPDIYEMPVPMLNFKTSQNIGKYLVVSFIARNILNSEIRKTQTHRGTQNTTESYKLGRTIGLGLTFRIK